MLVRKETFTFPPQRPGGGCRQSPPERRSAREAGAGRRPGRLAEPVAEARGLAGAVPFPTRDFPLVPARREASSSLPADMACEDPLGKTAARAEGRGSGDRSCPRNPVDRGEESRHFSGACLSATPMAAMALSSGGNAGEQAIAFPAAKSGQTCSGSSLHAPRPRTQRPKGGPPGPVLRVPPPPGDGQGCPFAPIRKRSQPLRRASLGMKRLLARPVRKGAGRELAPARWASRESRGEPAHRLLALSSFRLQCEPAAFGEILPGDPSGLFLGLGRGDGREKFPAFRWKSRGSDPGDPRQVIDFKGIFLQIPVLVRSLLPL